MEELQELFLAATPGTGNLSEAFNQDPIRQPASWSIMMGRFATCSEKGQASRPMSGGLHWKWRQITFDLQISRTIVASTASPSSSKAPANFVWQRLQSCKEVQSRQLISCTELVATVRSCIPGFCLQAVAHGGLMKEFTLRQARTHGDGECLQIRVSFCRKASRS